MIHRIHILLHGRNGYLILVSNAVRHPGALCNLAAVPDVASAHSVGELGQLLALLVAELLCVAREDFLSGRFIGKREMQLDVESTQQRLEVRSLPKANLVDVMLAIGRTDQNVVFRRRRALCLYSAIPRLGIIRLAALAEPLEELEQHRQQSARDLVQLVIITAGGKTVHLASNKHLTQTSSIKIIALSMVPHRLKIVLSRFSLSP